MTLDDITSARISLVAKLQNVQADLEDAKGKATAAIMRRKALIQQLRDTGLTYQEMSQLTGISQSRLHRAVTSTRLTGSA